MPLSRKKSSPCVIPVSPVSLNLFACLLNALVAISPVSEYSGGSIFIRIAYTWYTGDDSVVAHSWQRACGAEGGCLYVHHVGGVGATTDCPGEGQGAEGRSTTARHEYMRQGVLRWGRIRARQNKVEERNTCDH